jgi:hypothetical protein
MSKAIIRKILILSLVINLFFSPLLVQHTFAQDDQTAFAFFAGFYILYFGFICLTLIVMFSNAVLATICIIDIAKRDNSELDKSIWIAGILVPSIIPYFSYLTCYISLFVGIYYYFFYRKKLNL